jgi:putative modified peptide
MSKTMLPSEKGVELMRKLATDDAFRARFEADPVSALAEVGVDQNSLSGLDATCAQRKTLASKETFAEMLKDVDSVQFHAAMSMQVQQLKIG